jgi:hypothetical protein
VKTKAPNRAGRPLAEAGQSELLILADGRILAHGLTPAVAAALASLNPADEDMGRRAGRKTISTDELPGGD